MKKFTKLFLSCAAVAAITAAIGVSAMAADVTPTGTDGVSGTYEAGTLTVTVPTALAEASQKTIIVLAPATDSTKASWQALKADDIIGIDQNATIATVTLDDSKINLEDNQYLVAMGGDGNVYFGTFGKEDAATGTEILIGDADSSGDVDSDDSVAILKYNVGKFDLDTAAKLAAADADRSGDVDSDDSVAILKYNVGKVSAANGNEYVGQSVEVDLSAYED